MSRSTLVFGCDLGDPISCLHLGESACMAGTCLGKVWHLGFAVGRGEMLAGFSDEGIRGLYCESGTCYATCLESYRGWDGTCAEVPGLSFRNLDKKGAQVPKHVLQRGARACLLFPMSAVLVDIPRKEHQSRPVKLIEMGSSADISVCDFDGFNLALMDRCDPSRPPVVRLVDVDRGVQNEVGNLPNGTFVSLLRLWGHSCLAYVVGDAVQVYDYRARAVRGVLRGSRSDVLALDTRDPAILASLSADGAVRIWSGRTFECLRTARVPDATFSLGFPYYLCVCGGKFLVSADQGAFLVELEGNVSGLSSSV